MSSSWIAEIDGAGVHELHSDHLHTPRVITHGSTGAVEGAQTYGPYGELLSAWGYVPLTGYTGHLQTEPNGLIYMKGRFYSPAWHRFLSPDGGADKNQLNQYAYAGGNPMVNLDPSGMWSLRSVCGDLAHGAHGLGHAMGVNWNHGRRPIEIGLAAAVSGGCAGAWAMSSYLAGFETATIGDVVTGAGLGIVTGGTVGGGVAGGLSGGNLASAARGALYGGTMAAAGAFAMGQGMGLIGSALFKGGVGGGLSSAMGGDFSSGFNSGFFLSAASGAYTSFVGTTATVMPGENMPMNNNHYEFTVNGKVPVDWWTRNVIGFNRQDVFWSGAQSGFLSRALNVIPGLNAIALFHDTLFPPGGLPFNSFTNYPTMGLAAGVTCGALLDGFGGLP
jgi:RHS repeat-associated protein